MNARVAFRPGLTEVLEERVVMNRGGWSGVWHHRPSPPIHLAPHTQTIGPIGTLGDSSTDEYRYYPPDRIVARSWVELLSATRGLNFGPFAHVSLGEPRNQGYSHNWARSDATTVGMIANQLPGLADQVARGQVRDVAILVGANDFLEVLYGVTQGALSTQEAIALMPQVAARASLNLGTAVNTILAASPDARIVVSTINVMSLPIVVAGAAGVPLGEALLQATDQAVAQYNGLIRQVADSQPRVGLVDLAAASEQIAVSGVTSFPFGGTTIRLSTGNDFHNLFLADGIHPGTVGQGILANLFVDAFNREFGTKVRPLSEHEIVKYAREAQHLPPPLSVQARWHAPIRLRPVHFRARAAWR
ncbi:MAG: SGNH/GDSL hydrolase family protein [Isosphaeraceae bacterium]